MPNAYDDTHKRILHALLDKYERSRAFRDRIEPNRRIMLVFYAGGKSDFPYYDIENSDRRMAINHAVTTMADAGLLFFEWMPGEPGHILARVWLNMDKLPAVYDAAEREPKDELLDKVCAEIEAILDAVRSPWIHAYLQDTLAEILRKRSMVSGIPIENQERTYLLQTLVSIDKLDGKEQMERVFSLRTFGNTKTFEQLVRSRILRILRTYLDGELDMENDTTDEDMLRQIGIVKYPEQFEFCGDLVFLLRGQQVGFGGLPSGGLIYSSDFLAGEISIAPTITSVISIENRANYIDYIHHAKSDGELVIYHGGMYSPRKKQFLKAVTDAMPKACVWKHWGDIDYGGFLMLARLRREIHPGVIPYRMEQEALERYSDLAMPITQAYGKKLESLLSYPELADCVGCIEYMLQKRIRLEQEAMLL